MGTKAAPPSRAYQAAVSLSGADSGEVLPDVREVELGGKGEEVIEVDIAVVRVEGERSVVHGRSERDVCSGGGGAACVDADALGRVVVVGDEGERGAGGEGDGLCDELDGD